VNLAPGWSSRAHSGQHRACFLTALIALAEPVETHFLWRCYALAMVSGEPLLAGARISSRQT
jgi:hypothetical protein